MTIRPGDLVSTARRSGIWAVIEPLPTFTSDRWRIAQADRRADAGEPGMTLLARPSWTAGQVVRHRGAPAAVLEDDGGDVVAVQQQPQPKILRGGGRLAPAGGLVRVSRWQLALENVAALT